MFDAFFRISDYLQYLITAKGDKNLHSSFVAGFYRQVLHGDTKHPAFDIIENTRRKMIKSATSIDFEDLGGGKRSGKRLVSEIASRTAKSAKYAKVLYRILQFQNAQYALELGTGSGISTMYQACALNPEFPLHTIEGSATLSEIAKYNAEVCGLNNQIVFHRGNFDSTLPDILSTFPRLDYAFVDGNHRKEPTIQYYQMLKTKCHANSILIFDDINWSAEMKEAWAFIRNQPEVHCTIDIFAFGIVFFNKQIQKEKEHFTLRY